VRSLLALIAAGLSAYVLTEGSKSGDAVVGLVLLSASLGTCVVAIAPRQAVKFWRTIDRWTSRVLDAIFTFAEARLRQLTVIVLAVATVLSIAFWGWLIGSTEVHTETQGNQQTTIRTDTTESGSTTFRNLTLVFAALLALPIAIWRTRIAQLQATTAQREHLDSLYRQGDRKLLDKDLSVRLDGVHILDRLAKDEPDRYHSQIMGRLCAFLRNSRNVQQVDGNLQEDERAVAEAIRSRGATGRSIEDQSSLTLDLHGTNLTGVRFNRTVLSRADLSLSCLIDAHLDDTNLSDAIFCGANLEGANIFDSELTGAMFSLDGAYPASGLTQDQINRAWSEEGKPPMLDGVMDAKTGVQLTPPKRRMSFDTQMKKWRSEIDRIRGER